MDNFKIICYNTNMGNINGLFTNTIKTIRIGGIPQIWFAHIFSAQTYNGLVDLLPEIGILSLFAVFFNSWAVISYRKSR